MKLELPYLDHLAFKNQSQYKISNYNIFETLYNSLLENRNFQSKNTNIIEIENQCITILFQIFDELKEQAIEEREILFLEELFFHADRLLKEDINVYKARILSYNFNKNDSNFHDKKYTIGQISKQCLDKINFEIKDLIELFRKNALSGKTTREDLSMNSGQVVRKVVNELKKDFNENGILNLLSHYMGVKQTVIGVSVELSVPNSNWWNVDYSVYQRQPKTLYFHYD